jgi:hypothetical protein
VLFKFYQIWPLFIYIAATIETVGLKPLTDLLGLFGNWPMTQSTWEEASFDWKEATVAGRQLYGTNYFLSVFNYLDSENTDQSTIYVSLPIPYASIKFLTA